MKLELKTTVSMVELEAMVRTSPNIIPESYFITLAWMNDDETITMEWEDSKG